jgi:Polyketide cyclase / dehydrase and lipid transport
MASIRKVVHIDAPADRVWAALRDWGSLHHVLVPGFVTDTHLDGGDRIVTFFNGVVARERLITLDDAERRLVWSVVEGPYAHHNAAAQVVDDGHACVFTWVADFLPDELTARIEPMMERGAQTVKETLERG